MVSKIYAVKKGRVPGIYFTWDNCKAQTNGYPEAVFKSFRLSEAQAAVDFVCGILSDSTQTNKPNSLGTSKSAGTKPINVCDSDFLHIYTDGSYNKDTKLAGYGAVILANEIVHLSGQVESYGGAQVNGELEAVRKSVDWAIRNGYRSVCIHHDYTGVGKWADGEWKVNRDYTQKYAEYIARQREIIGISFEQVPAHSGITYNEMADKLARSGCNLI